jgi:hypothetical protein
MPDRSLQKPKTIDYDMTGGFTKGEKQLGIYEVDRDTFKSCFGEPGAERPTDFTSKPGDGPAGEETSPRRIQGENAGGARWVVRINIHLR